MSMGMKDDQFNQWLAAIPTLDAAQAEKAALRLRALGSVTPTEAPSSGPTWLLNAMSEELQRCGLMKFKPSIHDAKRLSQYYVQNATRTWDVLEAGADRKLTGTEQAALATIAVRASMSRMKGHLSLKRLVQNVHNIPVDFDCAFPGYLAARLVRLILQTDTRDGVLDG